jgi:hypothetical protein
MSDIEKQTREYLKAMYGLGTPSADILPAQNIPAVLAFARANRWIIEGPKAVTALHRWASSSLQSKVPLSAFGECERPGGRTRHPGLEMLSHC